MSQLDRRPCQNSVHFIDTLPGEIPHFVRRLLSKSLKFVPNTPLPHRDAVLNQLGQCFRSLRWQCLLQDDEPRSKFPRLAAGCRPPELGNEHEVQLAQASLAELFGSVWEHTRGRPVSNFDRLDRLALIWLRQHNDYVIALDTDKNLGLAVASRRWLQQQLAKHTALNICTRLDPDEALARMKRAICHFHALADAGSLQRFLPPGTLRFLQHMPMKLPRLRINAKVHKEPVASRPIINTRGSFLKPLATLVNAALEPVAKAAPAVVQSSADCVRRLPRADLHRCQFACYDVENLYPSIVVLDHTERCLLHVVSAKIRHHFPRRFGWATFLINAVAALLEHQMFTDGNDTFELTRGILTGLTCCTHLANIYLSEYDSYLHRCFSPLGIFRYIDDGLLIIENKYSKDYILEQLNSWHPCISVKAQSLTVGQEAIFLDLSLRLEDGCTRYKTYRKPQNLYDYLPATSAHPSTVVRGIVIGECRRLLLTNDNEADYNNEVNFFLTRLSRRGYRRSDVERIAAAFPFARKRYEVPRRIRTPVPTFRFKVPFSLNFKPGCFNRACRSATAVLSKAFKKPVQVSKVYTTPKSLFRLLYRATW